jgi:hypothetical protein
MRRALLLGKLTLLCLLTQLSGCEIPGLGKDAAEVKLEADSKATGAACRHALRGIEDCYLLNPKGSKTAIYDGWKEMDLYMRENKLDGQKTTVVVAEVKPVPKEPEPKEEVLEDDEDKPVKKGKSKSRQ